MSKSRREVNPDPLPMPPGSVFDGAIDIIETKGWTKGDYRTEEGQVCAQQALDDSLAMWAGHRIYLYREQSIDRCLRDIAITIIRLDERFWGVYSIPEYNDDERITEEDVKELLRKAHKLYDEVYGQ